MKIATNVSMILKIAALAVATSAVSACGVEEPEEKLVLGLWSGDLDSCDVAELNGTSLSISIMNTPSGDRELATVSTPMAMVGRGLDIMACNSKGAHVDGYQSNVEFRVTEECDGVGELKYEVFAATRGEVGLEGTIEHDGDRCDFMLYRMK